MSVRPWTGQEQAACLHHGSVSVTSSVTGETLARWCPNCTGTQYAFDLPPQTSNPARESGVAAWLGGLGAVCFALLLASLVVTGWSITSGMLFFICGGVAGLVRVEHDTRPTMDS